MYTQLTTCTAAEDDRLVQQPAPEIANLRKGQSWHVQHMTIHPEAGTPVEGVSGQALDIELTVER